MRKISSRWESVPWISAHIPSYMGWYTRYIHDITRECTQTVSKQGATLHGRGKHGEAEQARCHGQRNLLDELWTVKVRCAFVFFFCSPSRGHIFGLSAQWKRYARTVCIVHGVARLFAWSRGAGEKLNARQVEQKNVFGEAHANKLGLKTNYD